MLRRLLIPLMAVLLVAGFMYAQQPQPQFSIDDLKIMLADRLIEIEILGRQLKSANDEIARMTEELKTLRKDPK